MLVSNCQLSPDEFYQAYPADQGIYVHNKTGQIYSSLTDSYQDAPVTGTPGTPNVPTIYNASVPTTQAVDPDPTNWILQVQSVGTEQMYWVRRRKGKGNKGTNLGMLDFTYWVTYSLPLLC